MRINTKKNNRKFLLAGTGILTLFLALGSALLYHYQLGPFQKDGPSIQEVLEKQNKSDSTNPQTKAQLPNASTDVDITKSTSEVPVSETLHVKITDLTQGGRGITYRATISDSAKDGTCSATFTNSLDRPVIRTTASRNNVCGPVTIPETEFSALGIWTLTLRFYTDNVQAVDTKTVEIQ